MSEFPTSHTREGVLGVIKSKAWYGLNPLTDAFNWQASVNNIARELGLNPKSVDSAITQAITPDCLSRVNSSVSLLEALKTIGVSPHIWTVGDSKWQKTKFERSGASKFVDQKHYHSSISDKINDLRKIIRLISITGKKRIIVVDDKGSNLNDVRKLFDEYRKKGIIIGDYLMKLKDGQADATAFFEWFQQQLNQASGEPIELVLDFDGVVADTDGVLFGPTTDNLWSLLNNKKGL